MPENPLPDNRQRRTPASRPSRLAALAYLSLAAMPVLAVAAPSTEASFLEENRAAMDRMMSGMSAPPSGDVDRDFVEAMVPHHQGGIDMAVAELRHGRNEHLRRIAQEIIVDQQQEIAAMRLALGDRLPPSTPAPTTSEGAMLPSSPTMNMTSHHHASSQQHTEF